MWAQAPENRRILDVQLQTYPDEYRINVRLNELTPFELTPSRPGRPLRLRLARAEVDPEVVARAGSNDLIERVWMTPTESGVTTLEFALVTSQVEVTHHEIAKPQPTIVINLKLRPGVLLPSRVSWSGSPTPSPAVPSPTARPRTSPTPFVVAVRGASSETLRGSASAFLPAGGGASPALPYAASAARETPGPGHPALPVSSRTVAAPRATPPPPVPTPDPAVEALRPYDFFPVDRLVLDFPGQADLIQLYKDKKHEEALVLGLKYIEAPQSKFSLASLLFLLAECRFQTAVSRSAVASEIEPDWTSALNYYRQARRFVPDSPFDAISTLRVAQALGRLGRDEEKLAVLAGLKRRSGLSNMPEILLESGRLALDLYTRSPSAEHFLDEAQRDLERYVRDCRGHADYTEGLFTLGEIRYRAGDDAGAYQAMFEAIQRLAGQETRIRSSVLAHFGLVAHSLGKIDLAHPDPEGNTPAMRVAIDGSRDSGVKMRYAKILESAGDRIGAAAQYGDVLHDPLVSPSPEQVLEATMRLTRFALDDERAGQSEAGIRVAEYRDPVGSLWALYDDTYTLAGRADLLREIVHHLLAQGRPLEVVRTVTPFLVNRKYLPEEIERELRHSVWDVMADAMEQFKQRGDYLLALRAFETLGPFLADHPRRVPILLSCAEVFMEAGLREEAQNVLTQLLAGTAFGSLTPSEQGRYALIRREMSLDPSKPEEFKEKAQALLGPDVDVRTRARVLRRLAEVWSAEGKRAYAAQVYLEGALYTGLPWRERLGFYLQAAQEYARGSLHSQAIAVLVQGIRDFESTGVSPAEAEPELGGALVLLGESFFHQGDYSKSAGAFERYAILYPQGPNVGAARYMLGKCYERMGRDSDAVSQYDGLARIAPTEPFWGKLARRFSEQLRWEEKNPHLMEGVATP
ncbi:tetratricopeptide repeat protein [Candidatus Sumerlaeota bacterium]|nr:tetratricopeptide repeat protein [Candidatus Sumerlaeota bacterium]